MPLVLFNQQIGPYQVLPCRARVDLRAMAMKRCSVFPKAPASLGPHHHCLASYSGHSWGVGSYLSVEVQSVYSTAPADWAISQSLDFQLDTIKKQGIINLSSYSSKSDASVVPRDNKVTFLGKGCCNILTNKREITSDATGVTAPTTSGGFGQ